MQSEKPAASRLSPRLVVASAAEAITWYTDAFGAEERERYTLPDGSIAHALLELEGATFALTDAAPQWNSKSPRDLGGSPVVLSLEVDDPDAAFERAVGHGAEVVFPLDTQPYGHRGGRVCDPFGHLWIIWKDVEQLSPDEVQKRMAAYGG